MGKLEMGRTELEKSKKRSMETEGRGNEIIKEREMIDACIKEMQCKDEVVEKEREKATGEYIVTFGAAFGENVEAEFNEICKGLTEINTELSKDMGEVEESASLFTQAAGISEIGRETSEKSQEVVKERAGEYGDTIKEGDDVLDENEGKEAELKRRLESYR